jgi:hypothetical protein
VNGLETPVIVDDFVPTLLDDDGKDELCFAKGRGNELWVILLEKAWAKVHGSYSRINSGLCSHAASQLIGTPTESFSHKDIADPIVFWSKLKVFD